MEPLQDARRIAGQSADRIAEIAQTMRVTPVDNDIQYRTAGAYINDYWQARIGNADAMRRLELYERTAAHMVTTSDSAGVLPEPVVAPIVNFVDAARPLGLSARPQESAVEDMDTPEGDTAHRCPRAVRREGRAEQPEDDHRRSDRHVSQTFGTYVNVSRQLIDFASPDIMDIIINDMAQQYAIVTENDATDTFLAGATAATTNLATGVEHRSTGRRRVLGCRRPGVRRHQRRRPCHRRDAATDARHSSGRCSHPSTRRRPSRPGSQRINYGQGPAGAISRCPDLRHRRARRQQDPGAVHSGSGGVRNQGRRPLRRRAFACSAYRSPTRAISRR